MDKKQNIKSVFIATPQWLPLNPPFSLVPIATFLRQNGFNTKILDFNIEYYLHVLNKKYLYKSLETAKNQLPSLFDFLQTNFVKGKNQNEYDDLFKSNLLKYNKIKEFTVQNRDKVLKSIENIDYSLKVLRDNKLFYDPNQLTKALYNIDFCLEIVSLPFFPAQIQIGNYYNPFFKLEFQDMLKSASTYNIFSDFYEKYINKILDLKPDLIGLSINSTTQIVSALTLAYTLKKKTNAKIQIGGNYFSRLVDTLQNTPEFFKTFCDFLIVDEGEIPTLEFIKYLSGDLNIDKVHNLIYLQNDKVIVNEYTKPINLNDLNVSDLSDFDLKKYLTPDIVLPQQSSRGCYWGKCSFCDHDFGQKLSVKSVDKFIDDLEFINKKYGISHFELIDECISPHYLNIMSDKIKERNLKIYWFNNARIESDFTPDILSNAYNSGLRMLLWGFESASTKVMELINKGIDLDKRIEILTNSRKLGIWNFAFIFFGFPSETKDDAIETIEFIKTHTDIISSYGRSVFTLGKHTTLNKNPEKYNITKIYKDLEAFSPVYHFETSVGMNEKEINQMADFCLQQCNKAYNNPLWMYLIHREILFLYICKYGADKLEHMNIKNC